MSVTPTPSDNDEDFDIYGDLLDLNVKESNSEEKCDVESLKQRVSALQSENETLCNSNRSLLDQNKNLRCNISILYKTAAEEIKRKDKTIEDLQRELDSYLFRRNGRKPPDRGLKNTHLSSNHTSEGNLKQQDCAPPVHSSLSISDRSTKPENINSSKFSSGSRESVSKTRTSSDKKADTLGELKVERIIKEVPKKRKVIEYNDEERIIKTICDRKVVELSDRPGSQGSTTVSIKKTEKSTTSIPANEKEVSESNKQRSTRKLDEKKQVNQQDPCSKAANLLEKKILEDEKTPSQVVEPCKSSFSGFSIKAEQSGNVEISTESLQESIKKEEGVVCKSLAAPFLKEEKALPPNFPFQPPLPVGDPLPPPPPPSSSPPPTPVKRLRAGESESNIISASPDNKGAVSASLLTSQGNLFENSTIHPDISVKSEQHKDCEKNNKPRWSDENLHMQCPFKPRRRAKSVVVVEDDGDNKLTLKNAEPLKAETSSRPSKSDKLKRTPLKKSDIQDNRLSSEFRPYQTQRSVHSNRHLSLKSNVHYLPERRSPSELLNGRSGRIARISHQDKVRVRYHDRRSRSLSPQKRRLREDDHRTKIVQRATTRDGNRRNVTEEFSGKTDKSQDEKMAKSLKKKAVAPKEGVPKNKRKFSELFGESSPEPEERISKSLNDNLKNGPLSASTLEVIPQPKSAMNTGTSKPQTSANSTHLEADIIVIKRRPRSSIRLGPSENASYNTQILTVQTSEQESLNSSTPYCKDGNGLPNFEMKTVKPVQVEEQEKKESVGMRTHKTPLYFSEHSVKRSTSDDGFVDEDLVGESEESMTNADSDDTYNPKASPKKSTKRRPSKRKK